MQVDAIIVAGGGSARFGETDKLAATLVGRPVLAWSLATYGAVGSIGKLVVVAPSEKHTWIRKLTAEWAPSKDVVLVERGDRRRDSVEAGLRASRSRYVAIHDGARPLTPADLIQRVIVAAEGANGAIAAMPVTDTIKEVRDDSTIYGHPERSALWAAQTPQVVLRQAWLDAAKMSDNDETDDAAMVSRLGLECRVVESSAENMKITRPLDLEIAAIILRSRGIT
ncbi:MAG: 2-C-methyl-D-erythritol 4-phosphate cytidylyltransferase [Anaerolineaceae bacterium]